MRRRDRLNLEAAEPSPDAVEPAPRLTRSERPSRTQRKADADALQSLGDDLAALSLTQLSSIEMDDALRSAIVELKRTKSHEGTRRQRQLVGKLMRQVDAEPLREALAALSLGHARDTLQLHRAEHWRERLVADDAAMARFVDEHDGVDTQALRALVRRVRVEQQSATAEPNASSTQVARGIHARQGRAWRELFQFIRPWITNRASTSSPARPLP